PQDHITLEMAPLEIRHRSVRPISAKHAQASRFLQQSPGNSFGLLADFAKRFGLSVHRVRLAPGSGVSLAPFAD
ncbi:hypothetical protein, partial [Pseudomonas aeruginosa]